MRYQTKRKVRRVVLIAVLAAIVLGLGGWLIYHFSTPEVPLEERVMTLTADSAQRVTALDDGLLLSSGLTLSRIDLAGKLLWAAEMPAADVDVLELGDDVGTQRGMMFDPGLWRSLLRGRLARVVAAAKAVKPDILLFYHSDGQVYDIIPDLIDLGIDILNPVQPECMDVDFLKKEYGQSLSFWGCLGTQSVMPFGTVEEVRASVAHMIDVVGAGGGLVLAPTHVVEPEVPLENLLAMVETAQTYGRQRYAR